MAVGSHADVCPICAHGGNCGYMPLPVTLTDWKKKAEELEGEIFSMKGALAGARDAAESVAGLLNRSREHVTPKVGVAVIVRKATKDGCAVLMGKRKGSHGAGTHSFPGGHLDLNETIEQAGIREVEEETGIKLKSVRKVAYYAHHKFPEHGREYITLYLVALVPEDTEAELKEPHKCEGWFWFENGNIPQPLFGAVSSLIKQHDIWGLLPLIETEVAHETMGGEVQEVGGAVREAEGRARKAGAETDRVDDSSREARAAQVTLPDP